MLAATGFLGLLLMGVAASGLLAGTDGPGHAAGDGDDEPGTDGDAAESPEALETSAGTGDLAALLFGDDAEEGWRDPSAGAETHAFEAEAPGGDGIPGSAGADQPLDAISAAGGFYDVVDSTPFAGGPDIPLVSDFDCATDRLILDFDGSPNEAPDITVDLDASPGDAVVAANGVAVALVEGAGTLTAGHVDVVMTGPDDPGASAAGGTPQGILSDGGTSGDLTAARTAMQAHFAGHGQDAMTGGSGDDTLPGTGAQDALFGNEGDDMLQGREDSDELYGDAGADRLDGGAADDFLSGGEGGDDLDGGVGDDFAFGGDGADRVDGGPGDDSLQGGFGADTILGGDGDDAIDGSFSRGAVFGPTDQDSGDLIDGGAGNDNIFVGADDMVTGGAGADIFTGGDYIGEDASAGLVTDFDRNADRIEVVYDPAILPDPEVDVVDFEDGTGASITVNGQTVLHVAGAQGLDPAMVGLRALPLGAATA
jgi:Ca2+-binding RTX toxin-like protein